MIRAPKEMIAAIDGWAEREDIPRSEAVRRLIQLGLKAKKGK
jgi:metal-responsive CopG/Arc/MetJ family transcriptional regulator